MKNLFALLTFLFVSIVTALSQKRSTVTFGTGLFFRESFTGEIGNSSFSYRYDFTRRFSVFIQHDINTFSNMPAHATGDFYTDEERRRGAIDRLDQYIRTLDPIFAATTEFGDGQYFVTSLGIGIKAVSTKKYSIGINVAGAQFITRELIGNIRVGEIENNLVKTYNVYYNAYHLKSYGGLVGLQAMYNLDERVGLFSDFSYSFIPAKDSPAISPAFLVFLNARIGLALRF